MPRLHTPSQNPHVHGSHRLTPYTRRDRTMSPSNLSSSDKENATPEESQPPKMFASQAALRQQLGGRTNSQIWDPQQAREKTRAVMREYRELIQEANENRSEFIKPGNDGIKNTITRADKLFTEEVRSPSVANLDSRLLVNTSDLAKAKVRNMKLGDAAFNVDEFVAKLVSFMGGRHRFRGTVQAEGRDEDNMDWAKVGHMASTICRRPPTIGFMLGPLSVEKKERKVTKRQANNRNDAEVVRPQELKEGDIPKQENATSHMVRLVAELLEKNAPINLFEFVINPRSYGQTIENIFYVSFNVRLARAKIDFDNNGIPILYYVDALTEEEMEMENKQCVLEMTMQHWEDLIRALDITESIIPHREEQQQTATAQTWY